MRRLPKIKLVIAAGVTLLVLGVVFGHLPKASATTACPTDTSRGTASGTFTIPTSSVTSYRMWSRMAVPSPNTAGDNTFVVQIDGGSCYNVGGTSAGTYTGSTNNWTWIDTESGSTTPIDISGLAAGSHTYELIGNADNVRVDRIIFTSDTTCTPTGTGDNCANPPDVTAPTVSITSPANNATVNGTVSVAAMATDDNDTPTVSQVAFYLDGSTTAAATDTTSPYSYSFNTTTVANGTHTIVAKATDASGNVGTSSTVTVTVNNAAVCGTGTVSTPAGVSVAAIASNYTSLKVSWSASTPSAGCSLSGYNVYRDGSATPANGGTLITGTTYTDNGGFTAGTSHSYTVQAVDSFPNSSAKSGSASGTTTADNLAPNMPTNLAATAPGPSQVNLTWTTSTDNPSPGGVGVKNYNVYRSTGSSTTFAVIGTSTTGSYSDTTVSASTKYNYEVSAVDNNSNESALTSAVSATTPAPTCSGTPTTPGVPTKTSSTVTSINFNWAASTASAGCTLSGYHIYRADVSATNPIATVTSPTVSFANTGLTPNTSYTYTVKAFDTSANTSAASTAGVLATLPDTTAPTAPGSVTATVVGSGQINLTWSASTDNVGVTSYEVLRAVGGGAAQLLTTLSGATLGYNDTSVSPSTAYTYQVEAFDGAGNHATTSSSQVTTPAATDTTPPTAPTSPKAPTVATQSAQVTWTPSTDSGSGVAGYDVYINGVLDTYKGEGTVAAGTSPNYTASCLAPSTSYTLTIKAFDVAGNVSSPATVSFTTLSGGFAGDFDCNGKVNSTDLSILARDWQKTTLFLPTDGDANGDTKVNSTDLSKLATNWGQPK